MRILVTGGAGFIGSHIAEAYLELGHEVTVLDDFSTGRNGNVPSGADALDLDVRSPVLITHFAQSKYDIVNHHAAQIDVRRSVRAPVVDASINIMGTLNVLECCRQHGVQKIIFASSGGAIYGECPQRAAQESDAPQPESPYGISKAAAEAYIRFFGMSFRLPYTILRYANVYGPRQDPEGEAAVVSVFMKKLLARAPLTIYGSGRQERDYVFVEDVVSANCAALTMGENGTYNIGSQVPTSVNALAATLSALRPPSSTPVYAPARAGEIERSVLNASAAMEHLRWRPNYSLPDGLKKTFAHLQETALVSSS